MSLGAGILGVMEAAAALEISSFSVFGMIQDRSLSVSGSIDNTGQGVRGLL